MNNQQPVLIGGRYELGELLGRGGMAEVRKGTDTRLGRVVAVKRLRTDLASDATFQARFRREAQSAASLNHPAIVAVYDTGEEPATDGSGISQPYIVMEYVAGRTLRDILREGRKILPERALEITSGVLSALDYSHRAGIIHRDIKPGNVMLTPSGDVKVMDFGIARAISDASSTMTQTAAVVGTAQYLSPEQARGETVDSRSDVYSAGCLLYELLTGRPPFVGDSPVAVAYQHVREPATPPSDHDTELPPEIDAIVLKALAKRLEDRYQSAAAMRSDIERYLAGRPVQAPLPPPMAPDPQPTAATAVVPPATAYQEEEPRSRTGLLVLLGLLLIVLIAGAAYLLPRLFESAPDQVPVPNVIGKTEKQARALIGDAGLAVGAIEREASSDVPTGRVITQSPDPDAYRDPDSAVNLTISLGKPQVEVPFVVGQDKDEAEAMLVDQGFVVKLQKEESDEDKNRVTRTEPSQGTTVAEGTTIVVYYSDGREKVPDVVGKQQAQAETAITNAGFEPRVINSDDTTEPAGTVIDQSPRAGETPSAGSTVTIVVSTYVEPTETPAPTETATPPVPTDTPTVPPPAERRRP
ncbi:Stk1 family PASTA domain-containing Ser/Thr kinase [Nocardioides sp. LMS-CY]|uniref:non-specific serine/threonine protein kinase n=1 Tax=Nocardioides soli TaxID=1036020 RepID=A0A7W4Z580_9ACTN|nr:Stk1 family PASTA domain-containing Ser/Thr kinase [Nocardioides sp. LMS-CY]MBB3045515.1 serine/threonine-protein kinase [Nocardioides soli]QWF22263.1 Stk1 family PASTA domain-containing Ser/Thr kinase [Nocardioides sp. LMS-CY]